MRQRNIYGSISLKYYTIIIYDRHILNMCLHCLISVSKTQTCANKIKEARYVDRFGPLIIFFAPVRPPKILRKNKGIVINLLIDELTNDGYGQDWVTIGWMHAQFDHNRCETEGVIGVCHIDGRTHMWVPFLPNKHPKLL